MGQAVSVWDHLHKGLEHPQSLRLPFCIILEYTVYRLQQLGGIFQRRRVQKLRKVDYSVFLWLLFFIIKGICLPLIATIL